MLEYMKKIELDPEMLRRMHWDEGKHVIEIAKDLGISRPVVYARMKEHGIPWRTQSEAKFLRASQLTKEQRQAHTKAAHDAVRGVKRSAEDRATRAKGVEAINRLSEIEQVFADEFAACGLFPRSQYAVGKFNIDFAFVEQRIAVEIDPGNWHSAKRKRVLDEEKDSVLVAQGWTVLRWRGRPIRSSNPNLRNVARDHVTRLLDLLENRDIPSLSACLSTTV
jgi:very-short-patch-repair endonuclease